MMTNNNFQKKEIRQRMAETGEPYSVAARAISREATWASSPWSSFNKLVGKMNPEGLYVFASRNGVGKTTVALSLALHLVKQGGTAYYANMEMTESELSNRLIVTGAGISHQDLSTSPHSEDVANKIEAFNRSFKGEIFVDNPAANNTVDNIVVEARKVAAEGNLKVIVIDYLQILNFAYGTSADREKDMAETVRKLHLLTIELKVPIIILSQIARRVGEASAIDTHARTANIGLIQSSQLVVVLEGSKEGALTFNVIKNRSKRIGSVDLALNRELMQISDLF